VTQAAIISAPRRHLIRELLKARGLNAWEKAFWYRFDGEAANVA